MEASAALSFWQAIEYLAPQELRAPSVDDCVWEFSADVSDRVLPWNDPRKRSILRAKLGPEMRFQLVSGIIHGNDLIAAARIYLDAPQVDLSERPVPRPVACVVLDVDGAGMATGHVFVSTVPWALACLARSSQTSRPLEFRGFFGAGGLEDTLRGRVKDLLVERRLIRCQLDLREGDDSPRGGVDIITDEPCDGTKLTAALAHDDEPQSGVSRRAPPRGEPNESAEACPLRQLTAQDVEAVTALTFELSGWAPPKQEPWRLKGIRVSKRAERTQEDPLNSFYAEDIERVSRAWAAKVDVGTGLRAYLTGEDCSGRVDLEKDRTALLDGVAPVRLPGGCWHSRYPLVTAQQFAVDTALRELADGGLLSVNGPPGTGKTTLLKDLVAAIVTQRADALVRFSTPERAFRERLSIESNPSSVHKLDPSLCGFGIVVASANNNAVENITKELPVHGAVERGLVDYFAVVADSVAAPEGAARREDVCWGLIAAALGKKANRGRFVNRFWFEPNRKNSSSSDEPDPARLRSLRSVMRSGDHGASAWPEARQRYVEAKRKAKALTDQCETTRRTVLELEQILVVERSVRAEHAQHETEQARLQDAAYRTCRLAEAAAARVSHVRAAQAALSSLNVTRREVEATNRALVEAQACLPPGTIDAAIAAHVEAAKTLQQVKEDFQFHAQKRPGFWTEFFRLESSKRWNVRDAELELQLQMAREAETCTAAKVADAEACAERIGRLRESLDSAGRSADQLERNAERAGVTSGDTEGSLIGARRRFEDELARQRAQHAQAGAELEASIQCAQELRERLARAQARSAQLKANLDSANLSADDLRNFQPWQLDRDAMHRLSPFQTRALFEARRDVFVAALSLHKAFIAAAWRKLEPLLHAFVDLLLGSLSPHQVAGGVMQLWDAFFLVVPVVSSTFAAFPRQFAGVGREALAWLLIDEAGQAAPQQAAGAIWRTKRTVIVGDPLQLEPICQVPKEIMAPLLVRCKAEAQWLPVTASAQTLADRANRHGTWFGDEASGDAPLWVGCPLLVHRRCLDPMFTIANRIAYENKMVYGTSSSEHGSERPSRWIHVRADSADGHWVEAQAHRALALVHELTGGELRERERLKVYVISPFKIVGEKMKELLDERYGGASMGMAGTVHTFQGKEAEHVIFLLGGDPKKPGAISYFAGAKPNLVNVAVTRARRRLYVIGDLKFWTGPSDVHRIYARMAEELIAGNAQELALETV